MANLRLPVMGAFAEFERSLISERQREGIALAKQRGAPTKGGKRPSHPNGQPNWSSGPPAESPNPSSPSTTAAGKRCTSTCARPDFPEALPRRPSGYVVPGALQLYGISIIDVRNSAKSGQKIQVRGSVLITTSSRYVPSRAASDTEYAAGHRRSPTPQIGEDWARSAEMTTVRPGLAPRERGPAGRHILIASLQSYGPALRIVSAKCCARTCPARPRLRCDREYAQT